MDLILSLILVMFVVVLIVLFVIQPFTRRRRPKVEASQVLSSLLAERDRVLTALKELDFDNSLGKIPVESYPQQRLSLVQQGAQILRSIDELAPVQENIPATAVESGDPVEAFLAARRTSHPAVVAMAEPEAMDEAESIIARRRQNRTEKPGTSTSGKPGTGTGGKPGTGTGTSTSKTGAGKTGAGTGTGTGKIGTGMFCPNCGRSLLAIDRFCPGCGQPVKTFQENS